MSINFLKNPGFIGTIRWLKVCERILALFLMMWALSRLVPKDIGPEFLC